MITQPFPNVWMVKNYSNCYIVLLGDCLIIIDTGMKKKAKELIEAIEKIGKKPTAVLITHGHLDHVNGLAALKKKYPEIKVVSSEEDRASVEGKEYLLPNSFKRYFFRLMMPLMYKAVDVDETFKDQFDQLKVIKTPGHTKGSVSFLFGRVVFCGDLMVNLEKGLDIPPKEYNIDRNQVFESIKIISEIDFDCLLPGHGDPVKENVKDKIAQLMSRQHS